MRPPKLVSQNVFHFFGRTCDIEVEGWNPYNQTKLFCYNLHYFDDLSATGFKNKTDWHLNLIHKWIHENPPGQGNGWEAYPTSLRIVNWIKWANTNPELVDSTFLYSLALQAAFLEKKIEWHILGNHLFANAKALVFCGLYFSGIQADRWLHAGFNILDDQIDEQILGDGGHFELSPMYHAIILEDILDIISISRTYKNYLTNAQLYIIQKLCDLVPLMLKWMKATSHPDGGISFFNDSAFGISATAEELTQYALRLGFSTPQSLDAPVHALTCSGYYRLTSSNSVIIADLAQVGPSYLPGHAHADSLSFEMSIHGNRFIVNGGTSLYGTGAERHRQRGTAAHSTLCIEGENSSEIWGGFRVGRRAKIFDRDWTVSEDATSLRASHDGYSHLLGHPIHTREWHLQDGCLSVVDSISGDARRQYFVNFHLHPDVVILPTGDALKFKFSIRNMGRGYVQLPCNAIAEISPTSWHPQFGVSKPSQTIQIKPRLSKQPRPKIVTRFFWSE